MFDLSQFSLKGKVAIVTGGSRGIGQAIAYGFAKAGAKVVITSRKAQDLEATACEMTAIGCEVLVVPAHLGKIEEVQRVVDTVMQKFGRIDILVNNAGASPAMASVLDTDERLWDTIMNLNLKGVYFMSQAAAKIMKKQGGGKIINVASIDGFNPEPFVSVYSISKAGVRMVTRSFAMELARDNIQVNAICSRTHQHQDDEFPLGASTTGRGEKTERELCKHLPTCRIGEPDEIAGAAIYLASEASNYTTGTEIVIDGGLLLGTHLS